MIFKLIFRKLSIRYSLKRVSRSLKLYYIIQLNFDFNNK